MWFPVGIIAAILGSFLTPIDKYQLKTIHPVTLIFLNMASSVVFMAFIILILGGMPHVTVAFFFLMFCSSLLDITAFFCSYYAIKQAPISLLSPLSSFTPVFATFFGLVFLHEIPTYLKLLGILTVVSGMYLLNIAQLKDGLFKPFTTLFSNRGVLLYLVQTIIFGITPIFQKQAIFQTQPTMPIFASFMGYFFITIYLLIPGVKNLTKEKKAVSKNIWFVVLFGIICALAQFAAYFVFSQAYVGYATAIFSLSSLFTIIMGGVIFKESHLKERLLGAAVMIIGTILIAL